MRPLMTILAIAVGFGCGYFTATQNQHSAHLLFPKSRDLKAGDSYVIRDIRYNKKGKIDTLEIKYIEPADPYITVNTEWGVEIGNAYYVSRVHRNPNTFEVDSLWMDYLDGGFDTCSNTMVWKNQ